MSRTKGGSKGPGFDYSGRRPGNGSHCATHGKDVKRRTHKKERQAGKREVSHGN